MAQPIAATPPLSAQEARKFLRQVEEDLKKPEKLEIPVLSKAEKLVREHALGKKK